MSDRFGALAAQLATLVVVATALTAALWIVGDRSPLQLAAVLALMLPATLAVAALLYTQQRARRAFRQALGNLQARASGFFEAAMDPIVSIDEDQRVVLFNAAAEQVFRWPRGAVLGQRIDMLIPARYLAVHREHVERFGRTGVTSRRMGESRSLMAVRANGEEFPIDASISQHVEDGHRVLTVIVRDMSESVRAKSLLARSEGRLRGILDSAMDAIITVDRQQKVVLFNAAAERMFGCPQAEAIGAPLPWFIPDRFREAHGRHVESFGAAGVTSRRMAGTRVVTGLRRNGEEFPIDASISQLSDGDAKFFTVILRDTSERMRTLEALARSKEELRELAHATNTAREQEQARIARELHDEIAQSMSALKMDIALIRSAATALEPEVAKRLDRMEGQINTTIGAMRRIAADLRPLSLDDLGLVPALKSLVSDFQQRSHVHCRLALSDPALDVPDAQATATFRIVQESLTNVSKHARAAHVDVTLAKAAGRLIVTVRDDGVGFAANRARNPRSFGLLGVRERAHMLGGDAEVVSEPGKGTTVQVRLPVEAAADPTQ